MDSDRYLVGGFSLGHLIMIFILLGCALFIIYWLWVYPCNDQSSERPQVTSLSGSSSSTSGRVLSNPEMTSSTGVRGDEMILYATEIEPGMIVLQSPHGGLFRILREYDSVTQNGTPTTGLPPGTSVPVHYIPAYTRAYVQNQASAPPYSEMTENAGGVVVSPSETWRPLNLQSGLEY